MPIAVHDVPQNLQEPFKAAVYQWRQQDCPDNFTTTITSEIENDLQELSINIYFHERFPMGGQQFTVDIRSQNPYPDNLLHREHISYLMSDQDDNDSDEYSD